MKLPYILNILFFGFIFIQCSSPENSVPVDIYQDGSVKEIEVYAGNLPKRYLSKRIYISSFGDTSMIINIEEDDTTMAEIKKEIVKSTFDNGEKMIVEHWTIFGHNETLLEIHYFDNTGDILQIDDKVNGTLRKYAELHEDMAKGDFSGNNPFKKYLQGKWDVKSNSSNKKYQVEFKGSVYSIAELDYSGSKKWEEFHSVNYNWEYILDFRMLKKGYPKERIKAGKRESFQLVIDTKDKFDMENNSKKYTFNRIK